MLDVLLKVNNPPEVALFEAQEAPIILPSISSFPLDLITAQTHPSFPLQLFYADLCPLKRDEVDPLTTWLFDVTYM